MTCSKDPGHSHFAAHPALNPTKARGPLFMLWPRHLVRLASNCNARCLNSHGGRSASDRLIALQFTADDTYGSRGIDPDRHSIARDSVDGYHDVVTDHQLLTLFSAQYQHWITSLNCGSETDDIPSKEQMTCQSPLLEPRFLELISVNLNKHWKNLADSCLQVADFSAQDGSEPK
jgi:hypothetical protein